MTGLNADLMRPGLKALYYSGMHRLLAPFSQGIGLVFMLHQVTPERPREFAPNRGLSVTPGYLDAVLRDVKEAGLDIVSMDEACERLVSSGEGGRFACFTLDDGYRDNLEHACPVFRRHGAPFTVYIPSDFPAGKGRLWWFALEKIVAANGAVELPGHNGEGRMRAESVAEKNSAFDALYAHIRALAPDEQQKALARLRDAHGMDMEALCRSLIMTWDEVRELAADPLVTIGAHTVSHPALSRLPEPHARREMKQGADRVAKHLGRWPVHMSYPYGDAASAGPREFRIAKEIGFKTAVTTRKGVLFPEHADHLTALPRVSLNGQYQSSIFTRLFMTGAPFALWNGFRRVDAA